MTHDREMVARYSGYGHFPSNVTLPAALLVTWCGQVAAGSQDQRHSTGEALWSVAVQRLRVGAEHGERFQELSSVGLAVEDPCPARRFHESIELLFLAEASEHLLLELQRPAEDAGQIPRKPAQQLRLAEAAVAALGGFRVDPYKHGRLLATIRQLPRHFEGDHAPHRPAGEDNGSL